MRYYEHERPEIDCFREEYEFLSNFYPAKLFFDGLSYRNSEAAYQAQKCANPKDREAFCPLAADEAKRMGCRVELRKDWEQMKVPLMEHIVRAKFAQNPQLAAQLLATGEKPLLEGNTWNDIFWGIDLKTGKGENHLGSILMALREEYKKNGLPDESFMRPVYTFGPVDGITIIDEDITFMDVDCIVNATNSTFSSDGGVDGAIYRAAGSGLLAECRTLGQCRTGEAKITGGYELKSKYIIHTVGPIYQKDDENLLADCYRNCMQLAADYGVHSIAFPAISVGKYCFPKQKAMEMAVNAVLDWKHEHPENDMEVYFCCVDNRVFDYAKQALREDTSF